MVAGSPPAGGVQAGELQAKAQDFAERVGEYSGLLAPERLPPLEVVERPAWIAANLESMRPLLAPLAERVGVDSGVLAGPLRATSGLMLGVQVGALTGMLSQRVLGQYDLALMDPDTPPRLLLLAPNLAQAATTLGVDRDELVLWVTIHEVTHAVQFSGAPWLRAHLAGLLEELIEGLGMSVETPSLRSLARLTDPAELREIIDKARRGEVMRLTLGEDRWRLVEQMQSAMSLIEGHAEHTMDAVGAEVLPSLERLRTAMNRRRQHRGLPWRVLERILGLELKLRQYEVGRRFCDAVVAAGGPPALAAAWSGPEALPTALELEQPARWMARVRPAISG